MVGPAASSVLAVFSLNRLRATPERETDQP
jgi:hypothetical protein